MANLLRILGWIVLVGGSATSIGVFWIDHMNGALWALMATGIAASVVVSFVLRVTVLVIQRSAARSVTSDG